MCGSGALIWKGNSEKEKRVGETTSSLDCLSTHTGDTLHCPRDVDVVDDRAISTLLELWALKGQVFGVIS